MVFDALQDGHEPQSGHALGFAMKKIVKPLISQFNN